MPRRIDGWSFIDWFRHPWRTARAVHNGRGPAVPTGDDRLHPESRRPWEKIREADARARAEKEVAAYARLFGWYATRVGRRCARAGTALDRAHSAAVEAWPLDVRVTRGGLPRPRRGRHGSGELATPAAAKAELTIVSARIRRETAEGSAHHQPSKGSLAAAHGILVVDGVGLFMVFALLLNVAVVPGGTLDWRRLGAAVAFSLFGVGVLTIAAHRLGRTLWCRRHELHRRAAQAPRPRVAPVVLLGVAVAAISLTMAASIATRILAEGVKIDIPWWLLAPVAALLGVCSCVSPWLIVGFHAADGSPEARRLATLTGFVFIRRHAQNRQVAVAHRHRDVARRIRDRAGRRLALLRQDCESFYDAAHIDILAGRHGENSEALCPANSGSEAEPRNSVLPVQTTMTMDCVLLAVDQMNADLAALDLRIAEARTQPGSDDFDLAG